MIATNKQLLISESCGDSNRCTPSRGKPDRYATRFPCSVRIWSRTIRISRGPHIATLRETLIDLDGSHCSREKGLLTQSIARRLTDLLERTQFLSRANQWSNRHKPSSCRWLTTRHTRPINTSMRLVRSILARGGSTHQSLTETGGGYSLEGVGFHTPLPDLPNWWSSLST
jgi:hypothetical protein